MMLTIIVKILPYSHAGSLMPALMLQPSFSAKTGGF